MEFRAAAVHRAPVTAVGRVGAIRRYPVKAMAGEFLTEAVLDRRGLVGDRAFAVVDSEGQFAAGKNTRRFRRRDAIFDYAATTGAGGVRVSRDHATWAVGEDALDADLTALMGASVRVSAEEGTSHFDAGSISLVGTASLAAVAGLTGLDVDPRHLRVNVVVETDEPYVEETWLGRRISLGEAELVVVEQVERCRVVDLAQDGAAAAPGLLQGLGAHRGLNLAVYADVVSPGTVRVGDRVGPS